MAIELRDCDFFGPALPEPFVKFELEHHLNRLNLLAKSSGADGRVLQHEWEPLYRKLRDLSFQGGEVRVRNHILDPLVERLGYSRIVRSETVRTREGDEDAGWLMMTAESPHQLRVWSVGLGTDLDAPNRRGRAYRFSPSRVAQRVLLAQGERIGLLTDGEELRLLLCDPARPDSHIAIRLDRSGGWRGARTVPDSYRLLKALASPAGVAALPNLTEAARLNQVTVTKKLRLQARAAVEGFIQELIDHPDNAVTRNGWGDLAITSRELWREGLIFVYRLLFIFKLESSTDPARSFSFAATSLWRNSYSPNIALASVIRKVLDDGVDTGSFLEQSLRTVFRIFTDGLSSSELRVAPLGGALFGPETTQLINDLTWGEQAVAKLLDRLLWTPGDGRTERERVHYGTLDVEDLGRVYEALLELEPGITAEPMCRLRRAKLEVVVPLAQGAPYQTNPAAEELDDEDVADDAEEVTPRRGRTQVQWVEEIPVDRFYLRVGLGRKASGSYYTPHPFVRFLVQETLGPQVQERSPSADPQPSEILKLKVLDPAMGSGHFLVEACRYLGEALYEACRLCDERALEAEEQAESAEDAERETLLTRAGELRKRVEDLPDPNDELVAYLPSRILEGLESGHSQRKAEAICRRLVAVHCLYGVDKNELAVELAKLSLWLESYAEGLPLTFLDHRLVCGDSLIGPFFENLMTLPGTGISLTGPFLDGLGERLREKILSALGYVNELESSVGKDIIDLEQKLLAKQNLDDALAPFKLLAAAWCGGVMLGERCNDDDYRALARAVAEGADFNEVAATRDRLKEMIDRGKESVSYDLSFPEVYHPDATVDRHGFDVIVGNPPWDRIEINPQEFFGTVDFRVIDATSSEVRDQLIEQLSLDPAINERWQGIVDRIESEERVHDRLYSSQQIEVNGRLTLGRPDTYRLFVERWVYLAKSVHGRIGWLVPSSFHSNEGAAGIRNLYLDKTSVACCYSYENRQKLFEIDSRFKFDLLVSRLCTEGTTTFPAGFYLHDPRFLFDIEDSDRRITLTTDIINLVGGAYKTFPECRTKIDLALAISQSRTCTTSWGKWLSDHGIKTAFGVELHRNPAFNNRFDPLQPTSLVYKTASNEGWQRLPIVAGKSIFQYLDEYDSPPETYVLCADAMATRHWRNSVKGYRLAFRMKAASTNERSMIAAIITPGFVCEQTLAVETAPLDRPDKNALLTLAIVNSFVIDWQVRQRITTSLSNYILAPIPLPDFSICENFLVHSALRLTCNHMGYAALWTEQMGEVWRETTPNQSWPIIETELDRLSVCAYIDAVVAHAVGLDHEQYRHVLAAFSHRSYPQSPNLCLTAFDELQEIGLEAFCRKHDPYWDVPLNDSLPQPFINLPIPEENHPTSARGRASNRSGQFALFDESPGPLFDVANNPDRE